MLLILFSWLYTLLLSSIIGLATNHLFKLEYKHTVITICLGFFTTSVLAGFYAILFPINYFFHVFLIIICGLYFFINKSLLINYIGLVKVEFRSISPFFKVTFTIISVLILAQCASPPFIIDNESYYIQTIKWLNEFGFVKGLVNLHVFLGQTSGWHILQSVFNLQFIYEDFNDLSGLMLLLGNYYALTQLNRFTQNKTDRLLLIIGLFPVFNVFFFQFISAPSPDIAIYVLALIVFHQFIYCYEEYNKTAFYAVFLLSMFMIFIKPTSLAFGLLPIILYKRYYIFTRSQVKLIFVAIILSVAVILIKNIIITGNVFYPLPIPEKFLFSWHLPLDIQTYLLQYGKAYGYHIPLEQLPEASFFEIIKHWIMAPGLDGIMNKVMLILLLIMPFLIRKKFNTPVFWTIYNVAIISIIALYLTSPQYRFFFVFIMIFLLMVLSLFSFQKRIWHALIIVSIALAALPLYYNFDTIELSNNEHYSITQKFKLDYLIEPYKNSRYPSEHSTLAVGNTKVNIPTHVDFFWATGNLPLPAINKEQLNYFKAYFEVIPQQYSRNLKDGFYSSKTTP